MGDTERIVFGSEDVRRAVIRMAHEVLEKGGAAADLALIGVRTRGAYLARRIADTIETVSGTMPPVGLVDITPYRDDVGEHGTGNSHPPDTVPVTVDEKTVVLVDDVIYTGRTIRATLEWLAQFGAPRKIVVAVLVDRGERELPLRADIVGKNVRVSETDRVNVYLAEPDGLDQVTVTPDRRLLRPLTRR